MTMSIGAAPAVATQATDRVLTPKRETYDAGYSQSRGLGKLVRSEGQGPTGDLAVDAAHDNAGTVYDFVAQVFGRDSLDDKGMPIKSVVHFGRNYNNAFWDGQKMTYGDGDGKMFAPLSTGLDVVGHEMSHGIIERTAGLRYSYQPGALNESWADVFGEVIEQWKENGNSFGSGPLQAAQGADWLIGEDVFTPGEAGDALRSMKAPGTAYAGDPQPGHMKDYKNMTGDNGGVHYNSGIPNKAAYELGMTIGSEKLAKIWYGALTEYMKPNTNFQAAADATLAVAQKLYDTETAQAVIDAWNAVGITAKEGATAATAAERAMASGGEVAGGNRHGFIPEYIYSTYRGD